MDSHNSAGVVFGEPAPVLIVTACVLCCRPTYTAPRAWCLDCLGQLTSGVRACRGYGIPATITIQPYNGGYITGGCTAIPVSGQASINSYMSLGGSPMPSVASSSEAKWEQARRWNI